MSGCWVVWQAEVRSRPDVGDIVPLLDRAASLLRGDRRIADAFHEHEARTSTVTFNLRVRHGLSERAVERDAYAALKLALPSAGLATKHFGPPSTSPLALLRFTYWPSQFYWH